MKYSYQVLIVLPDNLEKELQKAGDNGWKLFSIFPLNTVVGVNIDRSPKIQTHWQLILEKYIAN
jgi:hypothetical protein